VNTAVAATVVVTSQENDIPERGDHQRAKTKVLEQDGATSHVASDRRQGTESAQDQRSAAPMVAKRCTQYPAVEDHGHRYQGEVKALVGKETEARAGQGAAKQSQADRTEGALHDRRQQ
jgi:hypothetical protein